MKTIKITLLGIGLLAGTLLYAQAPPPPSGGHSQGGNQTSGGSAPIGGGIGILLALGAAYGGKKIYSALQDADQLEK